MNPPDSTEQRYRRKWPDRRGAAERHRAPRLRAAARRVCLLVLLGISCALPATQPDAMKGPAWKDQKDFFWHPEIAPKGPVVIVVSLDEQSIYVYRNGIAIGVSPISSGRPSHATPTGIYTILQKEREHYSNLYDSAPMPFMQRLSWDGVAMHGGYLPGHPASHGCIRLPQAFAEKLFTVSRRGEVVVVADAKVMPAAIAHPAAVAPIDLAGRPVELPSSNDTELRAIASSGGAALNVVVSLHDRRVYVLQNGALIASSPLEADTQAAFHGTVLYVMGATAPATVDQPEGTTAHLWSAYRLLGDGPVPEPASLAGRLKLPAAFGPDLQGALAPGSSVLVTDLPGYGAGRREPYATLLESDLDGDAPH